MNMYRHDYNNKFVALLYKVENIFTTFISLLVIITRQLMDY